MYCGLLYCSQRRGGLVDGVKVLLSWIWNATFKKKIELETYTQVRGVSVLCCSCQGGPPPFVKALAPGEIMSQFPKSEKQNLLCFRMVSYSHDENYPNKNCRIRSIHKASEQRIRCQWHLLTATGIILSDAEQTTFTFKNTSNQCMLMYVLHAFCAEAFYQPFWRALLLQGKNLSEAY